jgi:CubicO group peptidase (beta-lactamase class C family)
MRNHLVGLALLLLAATVPAHAQSVAPPAKFVERARAIVDGYVKKNQFSGTVLVARDGKPILNQGFGQANRELNVPVKPDTAFRLGSITKQFTAASIMQLSEQGKLSIDDPIGKYYAAAPASWKKVTLKHLLTHRSGIPSYTDLPNFFRTLAQTERSPEQIIEMTRDLPLQFEPGSKFSYDNSGYIILGFVIEKVSGEKYADYVRKHILEPLGMKHSGYDDTRAIVPGRAAGYEVEKGVWTNAPYIDMSLPYAAGSLYSTTGDLLLWEEAFFTDKVVSKASRAAMTTDYGSNYGFGLVPKTLGTHRLIGHSGGINGFSTNLRRYPDDGLTVVVLSNLESAPSMEIAQELAALYLGLPAAPVLVAVAVKSDVLDRYVGTYELTKGFVIEVKRDGGTLAAQATGQSAFTLTPVSDSEFHFLPAGITMVFPVQDGPAPSFQLTQGGLPRTATRLTLSPPTAH